MSDIADQGETLTCPHFGVCGGCAMQDRSDAEVARWKAGQVLAALSDRGLSGAVRAVHTSPPFSRRRAVLSGRRTKKTTQLGFFARRSDVLVDLRACLVLDPAIMAAFPALHRLVRLAASRTSVVRLAVLATGAGLDVAVGDARQRDTRIEAEAADFAHDFARLSWNGEVLFQAAPPMIRIGGIDLMPPPGGFLQATQAGEAALIAAVQEAVSGRVADLFAGAGTFALPLAREGEVHAVEGERAALDALDRAWRGAQGLHRVTCEARDLFRRPLLPAELNRFDGVVLDPPRAGAEAQVAQIAASRVERVAYVSCNPATWARDVAVLVAAGYSMDFIDVVDQFRWSNHVEIASGLSRRHSVST